MIFGGKGGTGKTTSSCATANYLAHIYPGKRFLVISSDPAHSLSDSLNCPVGSYLTPVNGLPNLWAIEMDTSKMLEKFKSKHKTAIENLSRMSYSSDQIDIRDFLTFKLPGMEDMMVLMEIEKLLKFGVFRKWEYDTVIWDTAPTGHTLRLLELPGKLLEWIEIFKISLKRYRVISTGVATLGFKIHERQPPKGNVKQFIETLSYELGKLLGVLRDAEHCEFVPVTIAEDMSILETEKLLKSLNKQQIAIKNIIVNRVAVNQDCAFCSNRNKDNKIGLADIHSKFSNYNIIQVPLFAREVRGEYTLLDYAASLIGKFIEDSGNGQIRDSIQNIVFPTGTMKDLLRKKLHFVIFGGKGGVGKTTVSASTAVALAVDNPDLRILIFSTDPAHSLADSFNQPIGDKITKIKGVDNLHALEIDGTQLYQQFRDEYKKNIKSAFKIWQEHNVISTRKWRLDFDEEVMSRFVDTYPPGLEEVLALENIMDSVNNHEFDIYVFDTAPTGHLIQLLQFPELVREWLRVSYRAILKYHREFPVEELESIAQKILLSQNTVTKMRSLLTDRNISEFVAVTIPEAMGMLETEDLLKNIENLKIPCKHIVVNMIIPSTDCHFCSIKSGEQTGYVNELLEKVGHNGFNITRVPLFPHQIRGLESLTKISEIMFGDKVIAKA